MSTEPDPFGSPEVQKKAETAEVLKQESKEEAFAELVRWHSEKGQIFIQADEEPRPVDWMVDGLMTYDGITLYTGKSKIGKSSLTGDLAMGGATGTGSIRTPAGGWLFDFKGKPVRTYYLDTENSRSLVIRRLTSLAEEKGGVSIKEIFASGSLLVNCLEAKHLPPWVDPGDKSLERTIEKAREFGEKLGRAGFRFIILDVASHCYPDDDNRDENDRAFIANFFKVVNAIRIGANACVLLVHHHRKGTSDQGNESASGSGQWLRTPTTLISVSKLPENKNPDGDLYEILIEGRETRGARKTLKARETVGKVCRTFDQVEIIKEPGVRGAPATAEKTAIEILEAVVLKIPEKKGATVSPAEWLKLVERVNSGVPVWQKGAETLQGYLKKVLVKAGRVENVSTGLYRIL